MNTTRPLVITALLTLGGCTHAPTDTAPLEAQIAAAKAGDFGTCYTHIHAAAVALNEAEAGLKHIQTVDNVHTEATYPAAVAAVEKALAARAAADQACNARTAALEAEMPGIKAMLDDHEARIADMERMHELMHGVTFEFGSAKLTAPAQTALDIIANVLLRHPASVEVVGHASTPGTNEVNRQLSEARAKAVHGFLVSRGVQSSRISTRGFGSADTVASDDTKEGRRANQRAVVLHAGK